MSKNIYFGESKYSKFSTERINADAQKTRVTGALPPSCNASLTLDHRLLAAKSDPGTQGTQGHAQITIIAGQGTEVVGAQAVRGSQS